MCGGGLLGAQKQQAKEVPVHAVVGLLRLRRARLRMCGGGMLLAAAAPARAAVHARVGDDARALLTTKGGHDKKEGALSGSSIEKPDPP